jgi:hypothetical protein
MKFRYTKKIRDSFLPIENTTVFLDIVGFTKLGDNLQMRRAVQELHTSLSDVFRPYKWDERRKDNELIMIPTGDGYAIAFCDEIEDDRIMELTAKFYETFTKSFAVRIGISKGPNLIFQDLNDKLNIIGWGINRAQRVMAVAEKNQILCDSSIAENLIKHGKGEGFKKFKEIEVKHTEKISTFNYCSKNVGITPKFISSPKK